MEERIKESMNLMPIISGMGFLPVFAFLGETLVIKLVIMFTTMIVVYLYYKFLFVLAKRDENNRVSLKIEKANEIKVNYGLWLLGYAISVLPLPMVLVLLMLIFWAGYVLMKGEYLNHPLLALNKKVYMVNGDESLILFADESIEFPAAMTIIILDNDVILKV